MSILAKEILGEEYEEKAKKLALYYDSLKSDEQYTSVIQDTQWNKPRGNVKNAEWTDFHVLKNRLERKEFNLSREEDRFKQLFKMV